MVGAGADAGADWRAAGRSMNVRYATKTRTSEETAVDVVAPRRDSGDWWFFIGMKRPRAAMKVTAARVLVSTLEDFRTLRQRDGLQVEGGFVAHQQQGLVLVQLVELLDALELLDRLVRQAGLVADPLGDARDARRCSRW